MQALSIGIGVFGEMVRKQLIVMTRYPVNFITSFAQIFFIILLFTVTAVMFEPSRANQTVDTSGGTGAVMMYGFVLFMFMSDTLWSIGYGIREEQYQGTLEGLYLTPASKLASLVSRVTTIIVWTGALTFASILFVQFFIGQLPFQNVGLAGFILIMTLSGTFGLGFAFAAYTLIVKESDQTTANLLQFLLMIACAMFFPFRALPPIMLPLSRAIPLSYSVDAFRSALMGFPAGYPELASTQVEIAIVAAFGLLGPFVGYRLYQWAERKARIDGSLADF